MTVKWVWLRSTLIPSYAAAGITMTKIPKTHAEIIILRTVAVLNVRGNFRVDKYFSTLITTRLFIVMAGKMK